MKISIREEEIILDKERAIYLPSQKLLAISDLHLGKAAHFRKAGLSVPNSISKNDLDRLSKLIHHYKPEILLINGDMFHSDYNSEIDEFAKWKEDFREIEFVLVKGNHDKQREEVYHNLNIKTPKVSYNCASFCFVHDTNNCISELYPIGGHIHPGISISNKAKQRLKFPCFYFGEKHAILPAFSNFTGLQILKATENDLVFAITPTKIVEV